MIYLGRECFDLIQFYISDILASLIHLSPELEVFTHYFFFPINKELLSAFSVPGVVLGARNPEWHQTYPFP